MDLVGYRFRVVPTAFGRRASTGRWGAGEGEVIPENNVIHLFWTGGLDSTFRLLHILWTESCAVQPIYIVDPGRGSLAEEARAREAIRAAISRDHPGLAARLRPELSVALADIAPDPVVEAATRAFRERHHLGSQYDWLAAFARRYEAGPIEYCYERHPKTTVVDHLLWARLEGSWHDCRVRPEIDDPIFGAFRFPVIHLLKQEMMQIAVEQGFARHLESTWYCFRPTPAGQACGECNPCRITRDAGMARNTVPRSRLRLWWDEVRVRSRRAHRRQRARQAAPGDGP